MSANDTFVVIDGIRFRVRASPDLRREQTRPVIILFHGYSFSLDDWEKVGTFSELSRHNFPYLAVDLPRGKTTRTQKKEFSKLLEYTPILSKLFKEVGISPGSKLVVVGPSMGGAFALTFASARKDEVLGLVLVAPSLSGVNQDVLEDLDLPVLLIWGDRDTVFPVEPKGRELKQLLSSSKLLIIKGARHPVYMDRPEEFHELLFDFIEELIS
jgi:abhydrolase domain-containing protein 14